MTQPITLKFMESLEPSRDRVYGAALVRAGSPAAAETLLQEQAREIFGKVMREEAGEASDAMRAALAAPDAAEVAMPADVWARLSATIQWEAARSGQGEALNPESVLLRPDPLLAPRKNKSGAAAEAFELNSPSRVMVFVGAALLIGAVITIYLLTRPSTENGNGARQGVTGTGGP